MISAQSGIWLVIAPPFGRRGVHPALLTAICRTLWRFARSTSLVAVGDASGVVCGVTERRIPSY